MQVEKKTVIEVVNIFGSTVAVFEDEELARKAAPKYTSLFDVPVLYRREALFCEETGDVYLCSAPIKLEDAQTKKAAATRAAALAKLTPEEKAALGLRA